jgi:hypothetical protein
LPAFREKDFSFSNWRVLIGRELPPWPLPHGVLSIARRDDERMRVWDAQTGGELACLRGHTDRVNSVAFAPGGLRLAIGSDDQTVRVWDAQSGVELVCLRRHSDQVWSVAFAPDGSRIASGSSDETVRVWDAQSGVELTCLRGHTGWVHSVAFAPDGRRLLSGSDDQTMRVWDAQSWERLEVIEGSGDVRAIAATIGTGFRWRALRRGQETVVEPATGDEPLAWFPAALENLSAHPSGRAWAGSDRNHVYIIQLEGEPGSR